MNKKLLIDTLRENQSNLIREFSEKMKLSHSMVDIDELDTLDPEDFSHQYEAGEMEQLMRVQRNIAQQNLELLDHLDFLPKSHVAPGAYVETDQFNCLVAFATAPFECQGNLVMGISRMSPMYAAMLGKGEGSSFVFAGRTYRINKIC